MALQASANVGAIKAASGLPTWLRGIGARQVRLACGLVMFSYIFLHFFNHALGIISFDTMEAWLQWHLWWWRIPVVNGTLYTAAAIHLSLGLWALYQRRHFRYAAAEIAQLVLGFSIPLLLASHFGVERVAGWIYGRVPVRMHRLCSVIGSQDLIWFLFSSRCLRSHGRMLASDGVSGCG